MILYFNKNGQLLEKLEYGSAPRAGTTKFQIFAYFADLQPNDGDYDNYSVAMIRLRRPDLEGSEYPDLFMTTSSITFNSSIETSKNNTFQNGTTYYGFVFDFSKIKNIQEDAFIKLLDISGMWRATITLMNRNSGNYVTGLVQFNVEGSVNDTDEEPQQLEYEVIQQNIADLLQSYALKTWVQNNYVPYTGATNNLDLGDYAVTFGNYQGFNGIKKEENSDNLLIKTYDGHIHLEPDGEVQIWGDKVATEDWVTNNFIGKGWVFVKDGGLTYQHISQELEDSHYLSINAFGISVGHDVDGDETLIELPITNSDETIAYRSWVEGNYLKSGQNIDLGENDLTADEVLVNSVVAADESLNLNADDMYVNVGSVNVNADNEIALNADEDITLYAPQVNVDGDLSVSGNLLIGGDEVATKDYADSNFVQTTNQPNKIYGVNNAGNQTTFGYSADTSGLIVSRGSGGRFQAEEPSADKDVANKKYVDDKIGDIETILDALDIGTGVQ